MIDPSKTASSLMSMQQAIAALSAGSHVGFNSINGSNHFHHHHPQFGVSPALEFTGVSMVEAEAKTIDYRGEKLAGFDIDGETMICLPQAYDLFLKTLVGGLHTVYTKLKRLDIVPRVCNVEQVRALRSLGAIQPGVNRCKLIACKDFDALYEDCTNINSRPGRPPKRTPPHSMEWQNHSTVKKMKQENGNSEMKPHLPTSLAPTGLLSMNPGAMQLAFGSFLPPSYMQQMMIQQLMANAVATNGTGHHHRNSDQDDDQDDNEQGGNDEHLSDDGMPTEAKEQTLDHNNIAHITEAATNSAVDSTSPATASENKGASDNGGRGSTGPLNLSKATESAAANVYGKVSELLLATGLQNELTTSADANQANDDHSSSGNEIENDNSTTPDDNKHHNHHHHHHHQGDGQNVIANWQSLFPRPGLMNPTMMPMPSQQHDNGVTLASVHDLLLNVLNGIEMNASNNRLQQEQNAKDKEDLLNQLDIMRSERDEMVIKLRDGERKQKYLSKRLCKAKQKIIDVQRQMLDLVKSQRPESTSDTCCAQISHDNQAIPKIEYRL